VSSGASSQGLSETSSKVVVVLSVRIAEFPLPRTKSTMRFLTRPLADTQASAVEHLNKRWVN